jgi:hypothetical protein
MRFTAPRITMLAAALSFAVAAAPAAAQEPPPGPSGGTEATVDRPGLTVRPPRCWTARCASTASPTRATPAAR